MAKKKKKNVHSYIFQRVLSDVAAEQLSAAHFVNPHRLALVLLCYL